MNGPRHEIENLLKEMVADEERDALLAAWDAAENGRSGEHMEANRTGEIREALRRAMSVAEAPEVVAPQAGRQAHVTRFRILVAAAVVVIGLSIVGVWGTMPVRHTARPNGTNQIAMRDGSTATLSPGSVLLTPGRFSISRAVELEGEAWFDVAHDPTRPFTVETHDALIQVLGTRFAVRGWAGSTRPGTSVYLQEGSVELSPRGALEAAVVMEPGQSHSINAGQVETESNYTEASALSWQNDDFIFQGEPLLHVLEDVGRRFGVDIEWANGSVPDRTVNGAFRQRRDAEAVIRDLATYLGVTYSATTTGFRLVDGD